MQAQVYCTAKEIITDQGLKGFDEYTDLMGKIEAASDILCRKKGNFIPIFDMLYFGARVGREDKPLEVKPLLNITSIKINDVSITDYILRPINRHWSYGPYTSISRASWWPHDNEVEIAGPWGLYEMLESLGFSASQSTSTETTLVTENGSLLSPGMVITIEDEQEYVSAGSGSPGSPAATTATSKVNIAAGVAADDDEIPVDNGAEFFAGEVIQIDLEDIYITKIGGDDLSVQRGWNGTLPAEHDDDAEIRVYRTFKVVRGVNGTTAAIHDAEPVSRYVVPTILNYLCRQIAWLMKSKTESGFTGITGDSEMGSGKFYSEFPPNQINQVLDLFKIWKF